MKIGIYPGSFDPFTNGHLDIVQRARSLFDSLIVAVAVNSSKKPLFSVEERLDLISRVLHQLPGVRVSRFHGLLVEFARKENATAIVRGLRAVSDFDYELAMSQINREMAPRVETVFLLTSKEYSFLSSSLVKEIALYSGNLQPYVPEPFAHALNQKFSPSLPT